MSSTTPSWPSLYNPSIEILHIEHREPVQPGGAYIYRANDVFLFTFYWTLIFYTLIFLFCGSYAFFNYTYLPRPFNTHFSSDLDEGELIDHEQQPSSSSQSYAYVPLRFLHSPRPRNTSRNTPITLVPRAQKKNERRSRITFALLVLFTFLFFGLAGAVINSAVLGFVVLGLYRAGDFNMSTWIPFLLAVLQVSVGLLSIWPSKIEII
ncbi:hypothetical protein AGABI2DRAFT_223401 [Agaricus bisporus var. bisporus H97]|uniref:hypothetical protein n=1 Tax=Agaricus bisporus var. bisporus (strain H97 / ATCC MYA-4626 / FGSC 10389) TaxID=936046 RepID=UPI00029F74C2|nr:hypothetical protein AGABI2DRAFT_223401 [Agaricus bisporus var. bisporus H97]EKV46832.1 hypothetical protein AGABI2DRAFT_223401 [Agaricus bisporus var. bisporus H97]